MMTNGDYISSFLMNKNEPSAFCMEAMEAMAQWPVDDEPDHKALSNLVILQFATFKTTLSDRPSPQTSRITASCTPRSMPSTGRTAERGPKRKKRTKKGYIHYVWGSSWLMIQ